MLNRTLPPSFHPIETLDLLEPEQLLLPNGMRVFVFDYGDQELLRVQWVFPHLDFNPDKALRHSMLSGLFLEGTTRYLNKEIAEKVDYYGAFLQPEYKADHFTLSLYTLSKHLYALLPLISSVLNESVFPEKECETYRRNTRQSLMISLQKGDFLAKRAFDHALFGNSMYGHETNPADLDKVSREDVLDLYRKQIRPQNCFMFVAGKCTPEILHALQQHFGEPWGMQNAMEIQNVALPVPETAKTIRIPRKNAVQSALRIGQRSIHRSHPDFPRLQLLNSILGGYFGSRLMSNIREEKGYTYGIGSGVISWKDAAYFTIATEVGIAHQQATLQEIAYEIKRLQTEPVTENELVLVKNYILGTFLGSLENVFSHAEKFKQAYLSGLDNTYYSYYMEQIRSAEPKHLLDLANTYMPYENMIKVVVG